MLVSGATLANAKQICSSWLNRVGRLHIHLGRTASQRPAGIRHGAEVALAIDGDRCAADGVQFYESACQVALTEGIYGVIPREYNEQAYLVRPGKISHTRPGGRLRYSSKDQDIQISNASFSWGGGESPTTKGSSASLVGPAYRAQSSDERRHFCANEDTFDGDIHVQVEVDSSQSKPVDNISNNRSSMCSSGNFTPPPREQPEGERQYEEHGDGIGELKTPRRQQRFFEQGSPSMTSNSPETRDEMSEEGNAPAASVDQYTPPTRCKEEAHDEIKYDYMAM